MTDHTEYLKEKLPRGYQTDLAKTLKVSRQLVTAVLKGRTRDLHGIVVAAYTKALEHTREEKLAELTISGIKSQLNTVTNGTI